MASNTLKIVSYNIAEGGENRLNYIIDAIKQMNPDICGILEAVEWQNQKDDIERTFNNTGYNIFHIAIANSKYNIAILSKIPVSIESIKEGFRHVVLKATIEGGAFNGLDMFFVHFSPKLEENRLDELKVLLQKMNKSQKTIIMGDINSLSPHDPYDRKSLIRTLQQKNIDKFGADELRFDVINEIEKEGFKDAWIHLNKPFDFSTPTPANKDPYHAAEIRIDYAFVSQNLLEKISGIEIVKNKTTDMASDHYPIYLEITS